VSRPNVVYSIGHSVRPAADFVELLLAQAVKRLADVRRFPVSRRHPQFSRDALSRALRQAGIDYLHLGEALGGYVEGRYADYARSTPFLGGVDALESLASERATAFMCAEKDPWRCHRRFIAEELQRRGWRVLHILDRDRVWNPADALLPPGRP
jgi:uncharacterized protein (DUF488 family)